MSISSITHPASDGNSTQQRVSRPGVNRHGASKPANATRTARYPQAENLSDRELLQSVLTLVLGRRKKATQPDAGETASLLLCDNRGVGGLAQYLHLLHDNNESSHKLVRARHDNSPVLTGAELDRLAVIIELGRRVCRAPLTGRQLKTHTDVQAWASGRLTDLEHEEVWVLAVTSASRVVAEWCVGKGGLHGCGLLPSDILRPVLRCGAPGLVLVHNHPSSDPTPSREDIAMTKTLHLACKTVGVILLDHVIVSRNGSCSLAEGGLY